MKLPKSSYNWLTFTGVLISVISLLFILFLFIISAVLGRGGSYIGLLAYIVFPAIMVVGLILIPIGMYLKMRKDRKLSDELKKLPIIDMNNTRHRNAFIVFSSTTLVLIFLSSLGSYEAFHYTESVQFCGTLCHKVMEPEYVAYQHSSHANVACVECHVGEGADWYVRSKLSGMYQVYAVLAGVYPTPIGTPLRNLRPARETCEKCHWPQKFYSRKIRVEHAFLTDSANTQWDIMLQMKIGAENAALGNKEGIHWHINPDVKIEYISADDERELIPWVKYTNVKTNETRIYQLDKEANEANLNIDSITKTIAPRSMDCMDCHTRPSHKYLSPANYVDHAMMDGSVAKDIPMIKSTAMTVLKDRFSTKDSSLKNISDKITEYYKTNYADYYSKNTEKINSAIKGIQEAFSINSFPAMKVYHEAYPDHIGHQETNGCFRCHSEKLKSADGRTISKNCNLCHNIVGQGKTDSLKLGNIRDALEFIHPVDIDNEWKTTNCSECHKSLY